MKQDSIKKAVHWLLLVTTVIFLISGFGITQYRIVEAITFGLLSKNLSFKIHLNLWIPFVILLILHLIFKRSSRSKKSG